MYIIVSLKLHVYYCFNEFSPPPIVIVPTTTQLTSLREINVSNVVFRYVMDVYFVFYCCFFKTDKDYKDFLGIQRLTVSFSPYC